MTSNKSSTSSVGIKKNKLRTVKDVISRLTWTTDYRNVILGYDDRVHGPMEKCLEDYKPIDQGGDLPEHRLWYVRAVPNIHRQQEQEEEEEEEESIILWDKLGRFDLLFGSGETKTSQVSPETIQNLQEARVNMRMIEEERQIRRRERENQRLRRARQQARAMQAAAAANNNNLAPQTAAQANPSTPAAAADVQQQQPKRFQFRTIPVFVHDQEDGEWQPYKQEQQKYATGAGVVSSEKNENQKPQAKQSPPPFVIRCLTWNVLFDLYVANDSTVRWNQLLDEIVASHQTEAIDLVALQEVTPTFIACLAQHEGIQSHFCMTARYNQDKNATTCPTITPHGNLTLWNKNRWQPYCMPGPSSSSSTQCLMDGDRSRAIVATLTSTTIPGHSLVVANVHLPADHVKDAKYRNVARKRELAEVLGQVQRMATLVKQQEKSLHCLVVGDFNQDDDMQQEENHRLMNLADWKDAWKTTRRGENDDDNRYTFDPETNWRAKETRKETTGESLPSTGRKRIDCIYYHDDTNGGRLVATSCQLLGKENMPSDHYGLLATLRQEPLQNNIQEKEEEPCCWWSHSAVKSINFLLGIHLVNDASSDTSMPLRDISSSLPTPHLTLLHGFVELYSMDLVLSTLRRILTDLQEEHQEPLALEFQGKKSLHVFEHAQSATLVALPLKSPWLQGLYRSLCRFFPQCRDQERNGTWNPHVSLGSFVSATCAREFMNKNIGRPGGIRLPQRIPLGGLTIYKRSDLDAKCYALATVPIARTVQPLRNILKDAGFALHCAFTSLAHVVLSELKRGLQHVLLQTMPNDHGGEYDLLRSNATRVELVPYGSQVLGASLIGMSDLDATIAIRIASNNKSTVVLSNDGHARLVRHVLDSMSAWIASRYADSKIRRRQAKTTTTNNEGTAIRLELLTVKLFPTAPAVDLQVSFLNQETDKPAHEASRLAWSGIRDTTRILEGMQEDELKLFQQTLRILKLWAKQRQVYGNGFLGGGGWAVWLKDCMIRQREQQQETKPKASGGWQRNVMGLLRSFFQHATTALAQSNGRVVIGDIDASSLKQKEQKQDLTTVATSTSTCPLSVLAPHTKNNHAKTSTRSTVAVLEREMRHALGLLTSIMSSSSLHEDCVSLLTKLQIEHGGHSSILSFTATLPDIIDKTEVRASAATALLHLLVDLEFKMGDPTLIRPYLTPQQQEEGGLLCWQFGLGGNDNGNIIFPDLTNWMTRAKSTFVDALHQYHDDIEVNVFLSSK